METFTLGTAAEFWGNTSLVPSTGNTILTTSTGYHTTRDFIANPHYSQSLYLTPQNIIMQNKVAVFEVVRDENDKIIQTEFIKELWVETKNGQSVDFQVARDRDLAEYETNDLVIKVISTITF